MQTPQTVYDIYKKGNYTFENFNVSKEDKYKYGEIYTPFSLIKRMFQLFERSVFKDKNKKWLDTGAGLGYFSIYLYKSLMDGLVKSIPDEKERHDHIIKNMIYMVEIKEANVKQLRECFGEEANIECIDYTSEKPVFQNIQFHYIIGNPPYNSDGIKKVPTNNKTDKKEDGKTIWIYFIKRSISLLYPNGKLLYIVPSIWMKPDKAKTYDLLTKYKLEKIVSLNNTETNAVFKGNAQTPTCFFLLSNCVSNKKTMLYDKAREKFTEYTIDIGKPIPVFGSYIINKFLPFVKKYGCLKPIKTNLPNKNTQLSLVKDQAHPYPNIRTCILTKGVTPPITPKGVTPPITPKGVTPPFNPPSNEVAGSVDANASAAGSANVVDQANTSTNEVDANASAAGSANVVDQANTSTNEVDANEVDGGLKGGFAPLPQMQLDYSNTAQSFSGIPKLVLAHKMYGFPFLDASGTYGITNRDNYVIQNYSLADMKRLDDFLYSKTVLYIYESTRYRMKYLEKYAFEFIPDITKIPDFPSIITDDTIATYFGLDDEDKKHIRALHNNRTYGKATI
jgi:hypothetical protein